MHRAYIFSTTDNDFQFKKETFFFFENFRLQKCIPAEQTHRLKVACENEMCVNGLTVKYCQSIPTVDLNSK